MQIIVVDQEKDLEAVASRILTAKVSKTAREQAIEAIRTANPGMDLTTIAPGTILVIPTLAGARTASGDVLGGSVDALTEQLKNSLDGLTQAVDVAAAADKAERAQTAAMLGSADLKRASATDDQLKSDLAALAKSLDEDAKGGEQQVAAVRESLDLWVADLDTLRNLGRA
jgi:hypothetical protein